MMKKFSQTICEDMTENYGSLDRLPGCTIIKLPGVEDGCNNV